MNPIIHPLVPGARGSAVTDLHEALVACLSRGALMANEHAERHKALTSLERERAAGKFGDATQELLGKFQEENRLPALGSVDEATAKAMNRLLRSWGRLDEAASEQIAGTLYWPSGQPAAAVKLHLYRLAFGGIEKDVKLAEAVSKADGRFKLAYEPQAAFASLQVRQLKADGTEFVLTKPLGALKPDQRQDMDLVAQADGAKPASEYQRMSDDVIKEIGKVELLADALENAERLDITLLARSTGWDARLLALNHWAQGLAKPEKGLGMSAEALYGLLRVGLPADSRRLATVPVDQVKAALLKATASGVIDLATNTIDAQVKLFSAFASKANLADAAPGSQSSYAELLGSTGLNAEEQEAFAGLFFAHRGDADSLWDTASKAGFTANQVSALKQHGKFAFLAGNGAAMTQRLMKKGVKELASLASDGFYTREAWEKELFAEAKVTDRVNPDAAALKKLDAIVPVAYQGKNALERASAYAADMARKVHRAYPTQVLAHRLGKDARFGLFKAQETTVELLQSCASKGYRLGQTSVSAFLEKQGLPLHSEEAQNLRALHATYSISPSDEVQAVLLKMGLRSAHDVAGLRLDHFERIFTETHVDLFKEEPADGLPRKVHERAVQVSNVVFSIVGAAQTAHNASGTAVIPAALQLSEPDRANLIKRIPTMATFLGPMDYCECQDCQSVLSPSAYFVDLLQYLDIDDEVWANTQANWALTHAGNPYPHRFTAGEQAGDAMKPYDVLVERRPDLPHLSLSCENTHTALPYIDLVNEILEYHAAHGQLSAEAVHDTRDADTAELLAEPQNVLITAYDELNKATYPLAVPFDRSLEMVRQFCDHTEVRLHEVLQTMRRQDELWVNGGVGRGDVFIESLGLSPAEAALFTREEPLLDDAWFELYGWPRTAPGGSPVVDGVAALSSAKSLAQRLGVSYREITRVVMTSFVNPGLSTLHVLHRAGLSAGAAYRYKADATDLDSPPQAPTAEERLRLDELAAFRQRLADVAAESGGDLASMEAKVLAMDFSQVLVLADPDAGCSFDLTTLQHADGSRVTPIELVRINLFVRLWRRLGCSIEDADRALQAFMPKSTPYDGRDANLKARPLASALVYLAHWKALGDRLQLGADARTKLLTLWSDIPTTGHKPLYAQLFLGRGVAQAPAVFDSALGEYLNAPDVPLVDHLGTLQGAMGLTAKDIEAALRDAGMSLGTVGTAMSVADARLTLPNVSLLYRHALLAKALKLSVPDLLTLRKLSGLDPFKPLHDKPLVTLPEDHPFTQTLAFVALVEQLRAAGLTAGDLDALLRHRLDNTRLLRDDDGEMLALLKALAEGVQAIRAEHAVPADPSANSDQAPMAIRQFIVQTLAARGSTDVAVIERLLTEPSVLNNAGPLLESLTALSDRGLTLRHLAADGSVLGSPLTLDANTAGEPAAPTGTTAWLFGGCLEVRESGTWRFFIELDKAGAKAELRFPHHTDAVLISGTSPADDTTLEQSIELKAGVSYRFEWRAEALGAGHARLLVQGEHLPKGPLSRLTLRPAAALLAASSAVVLLDKALVLMTSLGLDDVELRHASTHAAQFGNFDLSAWPTARVAEDAGTTVEAQERCAGLRRLLDWSLLKRDMGLAGNELVTVFEDSATTSAERLTREVYPRLARLMGRAEAAVQAAAETLWAAPSFASDLPVRRLWDALQLIDRLGVAVTTLASCAELLAPAVLEPRRHEVARNLKDAVKARTGEQNWPRVAQPIFDRLRQRQRDALVAHAMHKLGYERVEQLYEHFLIDPGMEPVVQTSRMRLAIASVQLFVQRCFLNLEPKVHPSVLDAKRWEWMRRNPVWAGNRKLWLFPENVLEPEFRDDKTPLYEELEGALLQGDVSNDLVEDAFLAYLRQLDKIARLDMVAMHHEDHVDPAQRVLHVFGRTHAQPHEYFYRRFRNGSWTTWEPVNVSIQGDHLAPVVWRERLFLFWVTFMEKSDSEALTDGKTLTGNIGDASLESLVSLNEKKLVELQLHWAQYQSGAWTTAESGGYEPVISQVKPSTFKPHEALVHVSKEFTEDGLEGGVFIRVTEFGDAFYLAGRNASPEARSRSPAPLHVIVSAGDIRATKYCDLNGGALQVVYKEQRTTDPKERDVRDARERLRDWYRGWQTVLTNVPAYTVLTCNSSLAPLGISSDALKSAHLPEAAKSVIESGLTERAALSQPFFYQDNRYTFFVQPEVSDTLVEDVNTWLPPPSANEDLGGTHSRLLDTIRLVAQFQDGKLWPPKTDDEIKPPKTPLDPLAGSDWLTHPQLVLKLEEGALLGSTGQVGLKLFDRVAGKKGAYGFKETVPIHSASDFGGEVDLVIDSPAELAQSGSALGNSQAVILGVNGLNSQLVVTLSRPTSTRGLGSGGLAGPGLS
jgi:hypothetical protein